MLFQLVLHPLATILFILGLLTLVAEVNATNGPLEHLRDQLLIVIQRAVEKQWLVILSYGQTGSRATNTTSEWSDSSQ